MYMINLHSSAPSGAFLVAQRLKRLPPVQETWVRSLGRFPGEGNGNPLQYSCLENPMDRGAWQAMAHRVAKRRTRLSHFTSLHFTSLLHLVTHTQKERKKEGAQDCTSLVTNVHTELYSLSPRNKFSGVIVRTYPWIVNSGVIFPFYKQGQRIDSSLVLCSGSHNSVWKSLLGCQFILCDSALSIICY